MPRKIGLVNASHIKSLTLGIPESLKVDPDISLPTFLDLFCDNLLNLHTLEFTSRFQLFSILGNGLSNDEPCSWMKEQRAVLHILG